MTLGSIVGASVKCSRAEVDGALPPGPPSHSGGRSFSMKESTRDSPGPGDGDVGGGPEDAGVVQAGMEAEVNTTSAPLGEDWVADASLIGTGASSSMAAWAALSMRSSLSSKAFGAPSLDDASTDPPAGRGGGV
eukprot:scaffold53009_cov28-Tisochrysis_lutea.AAC.3